ncbi:restriction endonuclease subunit S [Lactobacillus johnsonii]|uniref:restriction endonuclease subunit S n=1 Tax=Lactobacillus johnsonii TaxID=33959 RepID=UPI0031F2CC75
MSSTLDEICKFYSGTGFPNKFQGKRNGKYPFVKVGDISRTVKKGNITLTKSQNYINDDVVNKINGKIVPKDTIIFAKIGEALKLNRRVITNKECLIDNNILGIKPKTNKIDLKYLFYFMNHLKLEKFSESTTVPSVRQTRLKSITINIPSIDEQLEIVNILENINKAVLLKREQLSKLEILIKARFVEMFGDPISNNFNWNTTKLKNITSKITNGSTPKGGSKNYVNSGVMFLRSQNIWRNHIDSSDVVFISEKTNLKLQKSVLKNNDILITKTGRINTQNSSLGRAALYSGKDNSANINGHVYLIRLKNHNLVLPRFLVTVLTGEAYRKYIRKVCVGGIDKRQINLNQVENFPIILPPVKKQQEFISLIQQVDKSKFENIVYLNKTLSSKILSQIGDVIRD